MRKSPFQLVLLFGLLALAACNSNSGTGQSPSPQPTQAPKPLNVYVSTANIGTANIVYALSGTAGKVLWNYESQVGLSDAPVLDHGLALVGTWMGGLDALNAQDGKLLWHYPAAGIVRVLSVVNGVVYGVSYGDEYGLFALNARDGSVRWKNATVSGELVADGVVYAEEFSTASCQCSYMPTSFLALNASDGAVRWMTPSGADSFSVQLTANGLLYGLDTFHAQPTANLLVRRASDGSVAWQFPKAPQSAYVSIIGIADNAIYVLSNDGDFSKFPNGGPNVVYALNAADGSVLWRSPIADTTPTVPTLIDQVIYLGSLDGAVFALNAADGKLLWHAQVGQGGAPFGVGTTIAAVVNGLVYLAFPQGFAALSVSDGTLKWQYPASGGLISISAVTNGVVYASACCSDHNNPGQNDTIYALKASDGSLLWRYAAPSWFYTPAVG